MDDFNLIVLCAFRYALGRMTYIVGVVANFIKFNIDKLDDRAIKIMISEISEANGRNGLGMECDKVSWLDLKRVLEYELLERRGNEND